MAGVHEPPRVNRTNNSTSCKCPLLIAPLVGSTRPLVQFSFGGLIPENRDAWTMADNNKTNNRKDTVVDCYWF